MLHITESSEKKIITPFNRFKNAFNCLKKKLSFKELQLNTVSLLKHKFIYIYKLEFKKKIGLQNLIKNEESNFFQFKI